MLLSLRLLAVEDLWGHEEVIRVIQMLEKISE